MLFADELEQEVYEELKLAKIEAEQANVMVAALQDRVQTQVDEIERLRGERDRQYDMNVSLIAENQKLRVECGHTDAALEIFEKVLEGK